MPLSDSLSQTLTSLSHLLSKFSQAHSLRLSPLYLIDADPTRSSLAPPTKSPKLDVTDPPADPLLQTPKSSISLRPTPPIRIRPTLPIHFSDALNSMKLSSLNSHLSVLPPPSSIDASDPTRLQVSCLCLLHLHAWDFLFGYVYL